MNGRIIAYFTPGPTQSHIHDVMLCSRPVLHSYMKCYLPPNLWKNKVLEVLARDIVAPVEMNYVYGRMFLECLHPCKRSGEILLIVWRMGLFYSSSEYNMKVHIKLMYLMEPQTKEIVKSNFIVTYAGSFPLWIWKFYVLLLESYHK